MAIILLYFEQMVEYCLEFSKNVALENMKIFPVNSPAKWLPTSALNWSGIERPLIE
jgi:hypothetical protein